MKFLRALIFVAIFLSGLLLNLKEVKAAENPLSRSNNFIGVHILFPTELAQAAKLVNSTGGDWGYVTIPIQIGDTDIEKWQNFMNESARFRLIPIIRIATEPNWKDTGTWRKPTDTDIIDMANFLNSLVWPTKNRYVILFNEVNRYDEWGGEPPDPANYASLVYFAYETFKSRSEDFFMIMGGLDNAAPNDGVKYISDRAYLSEMVRFNPQIFNYIDGFASHSYPNPNFSAFPSALNPIGVATYRFEYNFINSYTTTKKPVFITETGWDSNYLTDKTVAFYFKKTLTEIWSQDNDKIVAITPFLLQSGNSVFDKFSFIKNGRETLYYKEISLYSKIKGEPITNVMPSPLIPKTSQKVLGIKTFRNKLPSPKESKNFMLKSARLYLKSLLGYGILW